ncbi:MFS transporter [Herbiconiux sp. P15]|uniref:MFS transporter n=1 Tax=Herbiconiux liukaitaii TaxID=3342799 RepID=UPI0035B6F2A8
MKPTTPDLSAADAELLTPEGRSNFRTATISSWLGTTMEYVDFALYGLATALVFNTLFFPDASPAVALVAGFSTYAVGFFARPLGAIFFGRLGDRHGRKLVLVTTVALMGGATTLIGALPTFEQVGIWAPIGLLVLRIMQGFGAGAELSGAAIILAEYAPRRRRGLVASIVAIGSNSGTLIASGAWLLIVQLPEEALYSWGWRIPFLASIVIALAALILRRTMKETPVFAQQRDAIKERTASIAAAPDERSFWRRNKAFFIMLGLRIGENGPSYIAQGFLVGYVAKVLLVDASVPTSAVLIASILGFAVIPLAGYLSDRFGRRITYRVFCILLVLYAFPAFALLESRDPAVVITIIVVGMCIASLGIFGVQAAYGVELFGARNRFTKMALGKELGSILSGGTAPAIASALLAAFGAWWPLALYWVIMAGIGVFTTFFAPETRGRDLNLTHDATDDRLFEAKTPIEEGTA